jgi:hypothetical protein
MLCDAIAARRTAQSAAQQAVHNTRSTQAEVRNPHARHNNNRALQDPGPTCGLADRIAPMDTTKNAISQALWGAAPSPARPQITIDSSWAR